MDFQTDEVGCEIFMDSAFGRGDGVCVEIIIQSSAVAKAILVSEFLRACEISGETLPTYFTGSELCRVNLAD